MFGRVKFIMASNPISVMKYSNKKLEEALFDFWDREQIDYSPEIDILRNHKTLSICYTTDFAYLGEKEYLYEIQVILNVKKKQFEFYIDTYLADVWKMKSYEDCISLIESLDFDEFVGPYFWYGEDTLDCVRKIVNYRL